MFGGFRVAQRLRLAPRLVRTIRGSRRFCAAPLRVNALYTRSQVQRLFSSAAVPPPPPTKPSDAATPASSASGTSEVKPTVTFEEPVPKAAPKAGAKPAPRPVSWTSLLATAAILGGFVLYFEYDKKQRMAKHMASTRSVGTPEVGGPFDLIDANGARVTDSDLIGQYSLIYFGFTNCPDVCPTELKKMETALNALEKAGVARSAGGITPVFISIDPKRDTPQRFREYAKEYHPRTVWLTGSDEEISRVAKAYRIYWSVPPNASDQYLVDHSIFFFLMDRNQKYLGFYGKNSTVEEVITSITDLIAKDQAKPFTPRPRVEPPPPPPLVKPKFTPTAATAAAPAPAGTAAAAAANKS